eukprot:429388_1
MSSSFAAQDSMHQPTIHIAQQQRMERKHKIVYGYCRQRTTLISALDVVSIVYQYVTFEIEKTKCKILLLGAGEVGKRTIFQQLCHLYGRGYHEASLLTIKPHLTQNIIEAMRTLAIYSGILSDQGKNTQVATHNKEIRDRVARMSDKQSYTHEHYEDFKILLADPGIQETLLHSNEFQLVDTAACLFENIDKYWRQEYIPTMNDLFISRKRTTGVCKSTFVIHDDMDCYHEHIYDVFLTGGQKNERRKWVHFFDKTQVVIDVINLSGFCKLLWEDSRSNRLREDIGLFGGIVNLDALVDCQWIVILNKYDLLVKEVERGQIFSGYFRDFEGDDRVSDGIIDFIKRKLLDQIREKNDSDKRRPRIHFYTTNALNTQCLKEMFDDIHQKLTKQISQ